ncbi:MAG: hypothetical protein GQ574_07700 [Crocinitomix sp.]|nr:hypothetical protein [Crocinitomix sp.]
MKILSLFFVLSLWTFSANACTCDWSRNFLELCTESDVVLKFKAQGYEDYDKTGIADKPFTLVVEILEVYKGQIPSLEMRFEGDNGMLCRKYADHFKIGREYFFQYNYPETDKLPILDICGEFDLLITGENVQGSEWQDNSTPKMTLDEFEDELETELADLLNPSYRPLSNFNDGTARGYSDFLLFFLFGVFALLLFLFVRVLVRSRPTAGA